jgi:hypothetical protein
MAHGSVSAVGATSEAENGGDSSVSAFGFLSAANYTPEVPQSGTSVLAETSS